jgi:hypothetical protein
MTKLAFWIGATALFCGVVAIASGARDVASFDMKFEAVVIPRPARSCRNETSMT